MTGRGRGRQGTLLKQLAVGRSQRGRQGRPGTWVLAGRAEGLSPERASAALGASRQGPLPAQGGGDFIYNLCGLRAVSQPLVTHEGTASFRIGFSFACHHTIYNCPGERLHTTPGLPCPGLASQPGGRWASASSPRLRPHGGAVGPSARSGARPGSSGAGGLSSLRPEARPPVEGPPPLGGRQLSVAAVKHVWRRK